jgi:hypothetical protein
MPSRGKRQCGAGAAQHNKKQARFLPCISFSHTLASLRPDRIALTGWRANLLATYVVFATLTPHQRSVYLPRTYQNARRAHERDEISRPRKKFYHPSSLAGFPFRAVEIVSAPIYCRV